MRGFNLLAGSFIIMTLGAQPASADWCSDFLKGLTADHAALLKGAPPESAAITRTQVAIKGQYEPMIANIEFNASETAEILVLKPTPGKSVSLGGVEYQEFPNSTALQTQNQVTGEEREFLLVRGVRPYENRISPNGTQNPQNYVSDVLVYERNSKTGKFSYSKTLLKSEPEKLFKFEDPRISVIYGSTDKPHFFLSGTDYSPHVPGSENPDVMNRFVELKIGRDGTIQPIPVDATTGKPAFKDMSPAPQLGPDGNYTFVDAKNGTITRNKKGQIVVRSRLRPDFNSADVKAIAGDQYWHYGEQVFVFNNWKEFRRYDWKHSLEDLLQPSNQAGAASRVRPVTAREIIRDTDLKELYTDPRVIEGKKGLGPGSIPIYTRREGDAVFISDGVGAREYYAGTISPAYRKNFILADGQVKFLAPDHEIRYFKDHNFMKRHYSGSYKLFNDELTHIDAYYADATQPIALSERGVTSGIVDLQHSYSMGRTIKPGTPIDSKVAKMNPQVRAKIKAKTKAEFIAEDTKAYVHIFAGTSDANTAEYTLDVVKMLEEMSPGSPQRASGQVYEIHR